jgi:hypothetical protein
MFRIDMAPGIRARCTDNCFSGSRPILQSLQTNHGQVVVHFGAAPKFVDVGTQFVHNLLGRNLVTGGG